MPITLSKIASNTATVTLQIDEDTVHIVYCPAKITEKTIAQLQSFGNLDAETFQEGFSLFNDLLATLIKSWDVYEDDEQSIMFPIDIKRLPELPLIFRAQVLATILKDVRPEAIAPQMMN